MVCNTDVGVKAKLSPCALGLALGVLKGLCLLIASWVAWLGGYGVAMVSHVSEYYPGYDASLQGGLIGLAYGFIAGLIFGFIFAYLYNFLLVRCCCRRCRDVEVK